MKSNRTQDSTRTLPHTPPPTNRDLARWYRTNVINRVTFMYLWSKYNRLTIIKESRST